jgi:hypothetical protein
MTKATITIPDHIDVNKVPEEIFYKAFAIAVDQKRKELQKELKKTEIRIKRFEKKYHMTFEEFEEKMDDTFKGHDDWMDWSFLKETQEALTEEIRNLGGIH